MRLPRPGPISTTVSSPRELERVDDARENPRIGEEMLAEALSDRRRTHASAAQLRVEDDREIVALHGLAGVLVEHLEHALDDRRRRLRAVRCTMSSTALLAESLAARLRASLTPSVNSTSRSPPGSHVARPRVRRVVTMPIGGSLAASRSKSPFAAQVEGVRMPGVREAQLFAARSITRVERRDEHLRHRELLAQRRHRAMQHLARIGRRLRVNRRRAHRERHDQRRLIAVARDVADHDPVRSRREPEEIVEIAADALRGNDARRDRRFGRDESRRGRSFICRSCASCISCARRCWLTDARTSRVF